MTLSEAVLWRDKGDFTVKREFFFDTPFCASSFVMISRHAVFVIVKYPYDKVLFDLLTLLANL